ncbi:MAG TPA: hypothetical protein VGW98_11285 [Solirubrobacteraceae bacterium]|jgi:hypothetical protein|nr:hypothetical protein [Solirubrobacteraceae bacterium]
MANISNNWTGSANACTRPSRRVTAALAAGMLASGAAIGAAIGPSPSASLAGDRAQIGSLTPLLVAPLAPVGVAGPTAVTPSVAATAPVGAGPGRAPLKSTPAASAAALAPAPSATAPQASGSPTSRSLAPVPSSPTGGGEKAGSLAPVTNVWLIELSGSTFSQALAQPAAAPYIDGPALSGGMLLSNWSSLDASAFASEAALLAGSPPQLLDSIIEPPCPEVPPGAQCATGTPAELTAADAFLKQTLGTIEATAAYKAHGLIVVTFGSIGSAAATGPPSGSSSATLGSRPPSGVLLISPFAAAGARPRATFDATSPKRSAKALLDT